MSNEMNNGMEKRRGLLGKIDGLSWKQLLAIKYMIETGAGIFFAFIILGLILSVFISALFEGDNDSPNSKQQLAARFQQEEDSQKKFDAQMEQADEDMEKTMQDDDDDSQAQEGMSAQEAADKRWKDEQATMVTSEPEEKKRLATANQP